MGLSGCCGVFFGWGGGGVVGFLVLWLCFGAFLGVFWLWFFVFVFLVLFVCLQIPPVELPFCENLTSSQRHGQSLV